MKNKKINLIAIVVCMLTIAFTACNNDLWNDHYYMAVGVNKNMTLYQYIKSKDSLSIFSKMLAITGYDSVLNKPQTYTVWSPDNQALKDVDLTDTATITEIVKNHITRFSYPTSGISQKTIYMLDKKLISFSQSGTGYMMGGKTLEMNNSNIGTSNGILHTLQGYIPYITNIWEYIGKTTDLDSLKSYLYSQSSYQFDASASVEIGTDSMKRPIYDSVLTFSNPVLKKIGYVQREDSVFTAILPNNTAWKKAYNKIKSYFVTLDSDGGAKQQRLNTEWNIVNNLIFRQKLIADPTTLDTLVSSIGNGFSKPSYLFTQSQQAVQSNGITYVTDSLRFKPEDTYQKKIVIEGENADYGRSFKYANLYVKSSLGTEFNSAMSGSKYLYVEPTSIKDAELSTVTFPIPNTLSGKYNIYCVLAPTSINTANSAKKNKIRFYFSYLDAKGSAITDASVSYKTVGDITSRTLNTTAGSTGSVFTTDAQKMTKIPVLQYKFSYCNLVDDPTVNNSKITVKLRVENAVKITETVNYDRILRIDCIILEPVQ